MVKLDMKKSLKSCYVSKKSIQFIEVPKIKYICFQGKGDPSVSLLLMKGKVFCQTLHCKYIGSHGRLTSYLAL